MMEKVMSLLKGGRGYSSNKNQARDESSAATANKSGRVMFLGDVALAQGIAEKIEKHGAAFPFAKLPDDYFDADIVVYNLECCLSNRGNTWEPKGTFMRGKPGYLDVFPQNKQRYVANVANNHFLDYGEIAATDTIEALNESSMSYIGADGELANKQPLVLQTAGGSVALLGFAPCAHRMSSEARVNVTSERPRDIVNAVEQARGCADVLVVSLHQGVEHCKYTPRNSRLLARAVVEAGADLVVVHHTHIIQGIEQVGDGIIFHGIGNFLLDVPQDWRPAGAQNLVIRIEIANGSIATLSVEPVEINEEWQPVVLEGSSRDKVLSQVTKLSTLFGSKFGVAVNDAGALKSWLGDQMTRFWKISQRAGVLATASYYRGRIVDKVGARLSRRRKSLSER